MRRHPCPGLDDQRGAVRSARELPLSTDLLARMDAYWRASNYLAVGQIYLLDNPLLESRSDAST